MVGRVPLSRRDLLADRRRLVVSAIGVGLALMLILLLDGMWAGIDAKTTIYEDHSGADLYVAQAGSRNFFSTTSTIPDSTVDQLKADPDVRWAAPVRGQFSILELHDTKVPAYLVGWQPGQPGGPWSIVDGCAPQADAEIAIGRVVADRHGITPGDHLTHRWLDVRLRPTRYAWTIGVVAVLVLWAHQQSNAEFIINARV